MRNLKRALSLALASVMLLGMMVVGTSAASYADVDAQDNLEAIEVLKAVGVMSGDDKGNFNPDQLVTRTEMAVVMCNLLGLTPGGSHPFKDVAPWADGFVAACYNNGIIAGYNSTTYGANDSVTAAQAALMVMKALGYFGYMGEFGDNWKLATVKQAQEINLYDGINAYSDQAMTRNNIAQMVLNALECDVIVVREEGGLNVDGNGISVSQKPTYTKTPAENKSGKDYAGAAANSEQMKTMQLCEKLYGNDLKKNTDSTDSFGRPTTEWTYKDSTISTPKATAKVYTAETKISDIAKDLGVNLAKEDVLYRQNGANEASSQDNSSTALNNTALNESVTAKIGGDGTVIEVYYDRDKASNKARVIFYDYYLAQASEDYDADDKEVDINIFDSTTTSATLKADDFGNIVNVKEDDYLVVTIAGSTVKTVAPATIVENVTVSVARNSDYVTANGTKYVYSDAAVANTATLGRSLMTGSGYDLNGDGYNLYLDPNGYVLGVKGYDAGVNLDNYLFVKAASSNGFDVIAKALFSDGTTKTITVSEIDGADATTSNFNGDDDLMFYTYEVDGDGNYKLTNVANSISGSTEVAEGSSLDKDITATVNPIEGNTTQYATSSTLFIAKDKVYTGVKNAPKIVSETSTAQNDVYYLYDKDNRLLLVYGTKSGSVETSSDNVVYVLNNTPAKAKDGDTTYYIYDVVINGEKTTLEANQNSKAAGLYKIDTYTDGRADLGTAISASANEFLVGTGVTALSFKDSVLSVTGSAAAGGYYLAEKVVVNTIDGNTVKTVSPSSLGAKTISDGFDDIYMVKAKNEANADIIAVYLVK